MSLRRNKIKTLFDAYAPPGPDLPLG